MYYMNFKHLKGYIAELIAYIYFCFQGYKYCGRKVNHFTQIDLEFEKQDKYLVVEVKYISDTNRYSYLSFEQFYKQYLYMKKLSQFQEKEIFYHLIIINKVFCINKNISFKFIGQNPYELYRIIHIMS